jgi:hypothetical protein
MGDRISTDAEALFSMTCTYPGLLAAHGAGVDTARAFLRYSKTRTCRLLSIDQDEPTSGAANIGAATATLLRPTAPQMAASGWLDGLTGRISAKVAQTNHWTHPASEAALLQFCCAVALEVATPQNIHEYAM